MSQYVALTCSALARPIYSIAATVPSAISVQMLDQGLHRVSESLRERLQNHIDSVKPDELDAILLVYGICGTSTLDLIARDTPLVISRVHDCIGLYLGSNKRYLKEYNAHPGTYWYSVDYMERKGGRTQIERFRVMFLCRPVTETRAPKRCHAELDSVSVVDGNK
jgi:hypothetical protein